MIYSGSDLIAVEFSTISPPFGLEVDLFYYGSDHAYQPMMSAFEEAKRKLRPGGLVVAVDVAWNASLWDFAERCGAPSYTFKNAVGVGFF